MLDRDLAQLYGVDTKVLKQSVKRHSDRFPNDFMFEMAKTEFEAWRTKFAISQNDKIGLRYAPMCFTEQGVAMLSSILNSDLAIQVNIQIIRIFTKMRELISMNSDILIKLEQIERKDIEQDEKIILIFEFLRQLEQKQHEETEFKARPKIGFKPGTKN